MSKGFLKICKLITNLILGQIRHTVFRGLDWTGLVKRRLVKRGLVKRGLVKHGLVKRGLVKLGLRIGSCGRLFFFRFFSLFVNRIKLNGEQTSTKTNLRLKILFIYF